jgi:hypothetical protein
MQCISNINLTSSSISAKYVQGTEKWCGSLYSSVQQHDANYSSLLQCQGKEYMELYLDSSLLTPSHSDKHMIKQQACKAE